MFFVLALRAAVSRSGALCPAAIFEMILQLLSAFLKANSYCLKRTNKVAKENKNNTLLCSRYSFGDGREKTGQKGWIRVGLTLRSRSFRVNA